MMSYSEVQKSLQESSTGKPLSNKEIIDLIDKVRVYDIGLRPDKSADA